MSGFVSFLNSEKDGRGIPYVICLHRGWRRMIPPAETAGDRMLTVDFWLFCQGGCGAAAQNHILRVNTDDSGAAVGRSDPFL